jgi:predicted heme/steroid binding protein
MIEILDISSEVAWAAVFFIVFVIYARFFTIPEINEQSAAE